MVGHTQKVDYGGEEEAETAGTLSGSWPEVMLCGSRRCQGESRTLQICVRATNQGKNKKKKQKQNRALVRFTVTFLLFLDYSKLQDSLFCAGGIFRKKMKD